MMIKKCSFRDFCLSFLSKSYFIVIFYIVLVTCFLSSKLQWIWPVEYKLPNELLYLGALALVIIFYRLKCLKMSDKVFWALLSMLSIAFGYFQIAISLWFPEGQNADFLALYQQTHLLVEGHGFSDSELLNYFNKFRMYEIILYIFTFIMSLFGSWRAVIVIGSLATLASVFITSLVTRNITKNNFLALLSYIIGYVLICLNWRSFLPYSDNYAMLFPVLCLFIYSSGNINARKIILVSLFATIGFFIKATSIIPTLAILIYGLLTSEKELKSLSLSFLKYSLPIIVLTCSLFCFGQNALNKKYNYSYLDTETVGVSKYLLCGQTTKYYGTVPGFSDKNYIDPYAGIRSPKRLLWIIRDRGLLGNVKFYSGKTLLTYRDGMFNTLQSKANKSEIDRCKKSGKFKFLLSNNSAYICYVSLVQLFWNVILIMMLSLSFAKHDKLFYVIVTTFLGVFLYLMIFETRAKYLFLFLPFIISGGFKGLSDFSINNLKILFKHNIILK